MDGMECSSDAERNDSGACGRVGCQCRQPLFGTGGHDLAAAIVVGCRQAMCLESTKYLLRITADDGGHRGWRSCAGIGHRTTTLAYEDHCLLCGKDADSGSCGDFAYGVACDHTHQWKTIGWMREQFECGEQTGPYQERLCNRCVSNGFGVSFGAVMAQIEA